MPENDNSHDDLAIKTYFNQWSVYNMIITNDYMAHTGIHSALGQQLELIEKPFSMLDLGCGDASNIAGILKSLEVKNYTGVDLSSVALEQAKAHFSATAVKARFIEMDFTHYLAFEHQQPVDVILAGFTLHHLTTESKQIFFAACSERLSSGGVLLLYDLFRHDNQSLAAYYEAYCAQIDQWQALSQQDRDNTLKHVRENDFPETYETISLMALKAGLSIPARPLYEDASQFHRLYCCNKK